MKKNPYSDKELIAMITQAGAARDQALQAIFLDWGSSAIGILMSKGVSKEKAEDARQEAIITLDKHLRNGQFRGESSLRSYFIGICKGKVFTDRRRTGRIDWTDEDYKLDGVEKQEPEKVMLEQERRAIVLELFEAKALGEKCKQLLGLYRLGLSMQEIGDRAKLSNPNTTRQRVFKCRKKLEKIAKENSFLKNYFKQ